MTKVRLMTRPMRYWPLAALSIAGCAGFGGTAPPVTEFDFNGQWRGAYSCLELGELGHIGLTVSGTALHGTFIDAYSGKAGSISGVMDGMDLKSGTFVFDGEEPRPIEGFFYEDGQGIQQVIGEFDMTLSEKRVVFFAMWLKR